MDETSGGLSAPSRDERILAAVAHISFIVPYVGVIVSILIWITQKDKSRFVGFQALQALAYQIVLFLGYIVGMMCYAGSAFSLMFSMPFSRGGSGGFPTFFALPFTVLGILALLWLCSVIYAVVAAVMVMQGKDFRYAIIGKRLDRYLNE